MTDVEKIRELLDAARASEQMDESLSMLNQAHRLCIDTEEPITAELVEEVVVSMHDANALREMHLRARREKRDSGATLVLSPERLAELRAEAERDSQCPQ